MGFALTLYYLFATFLTPAEIMPALVPYRIMLVLLLVTLLASIFTMFGSRFSFRAPQLPLLLALVADCAVTVLYADRWFGGALDAVLDLLFLAGIVLMVCWNVITINRLRALAFVLAAIGIIITVQGTLALETGLGNEHFVLHEHDQDQAGHPISIDRIEGLGVLNDPNDLGQFLLIAIALLGCCWKRGKFGANLFPVIVPSLILLGGVFLTRSRGAMLGLMVLVLFVLQKRLGKFGTFIGAGAGLAGLLAMTVLTGRGLSMTEGSAAGRLDAWYAGLQMLKGSPLFGVGYQRFLQHNPLTAHNSYMLALAELGLPGFLIWLALIVASILQVYSISSLPGGTPPLDDVKHAARSVYLAFMMFVVTAWFLSRSYTTILFVLIGCAVAITEIARRAGAIGEDTKTVSWSFATVVTGVMFVASVYVLLRLRGISS